MIVDHDQIMGWNGKYPRASQYPWTFMCTNTTTYKNGITSGFRYRYFDPSGSFYDHRTATRYLTIKKYKNYRSMTYVPFFKAIINQAKEKDKSVEGIEPFLNTWRMDTSLLATALMEHKLWAHGCG